MTKLMAKYGGGTDEAALQRGQVQAIKDLRPWITWNPRYGTSTSSRAASSRTSSRDSGRSGAAPPAAPRSSRRGMPLIVVTTSPRVAPGLLSRPRGRSSRTGRVRTGAADHPHLPYLAEAGVAVEFVTPDPAALVREARAGGRVAGGRRGDPMRSTATRPWRSASRRRSSSCPAPTTCRGRGCSTWSR